MGTNAVNSGSQITLDQLDALYSRLYTLTNTHKNHQYQTNETNIPDAKASSGLAQGSLVTTAPFTELKQELTNLSNSQWFTPGTTTEAKTSMTDYGSSITIPSIGELIEASDFNLLETAITNAESIVPNYSSKYSSCYGSRYGSRYSSCYGSRYSSCYGSRYGSCYGSRYSSCYGSQYKGCFSAA